MNLYETADAYLLTAELPGVEPAGGVSAKMHDGVLELVLPKSAERRPRAIPVQAG